MASLNREDHKQISFKLQGVDRIFVGYSIIGTIIFIFLLPHVSSFDGIWIWGMPRTAFSILFFGSIVNGLVTISMFVLYGRFFIAKVRSNQLEHRVGERNVP